MVFLRRQSNMLIADVDQINKETLEISASDDEVYSDMAILAEELPTHSPRFVLLSYPLTLVSGLAVQLTR